MHVLYRVTRIGKDCPLTAFAQQPTEAISGVDLNAERILPQLKRNDDLVASQASEGGGKQLVKKKAR
jgi:hypothetical protein